MEVSDALIFRRFHPGEFALVAFCAEKVLDPTQRDRICGELKNKTFSLTDGCHEKSQFGEKLLIV